MSCSNSFTDVDLNKSAILRAVVTAVIAALFFVLFSSLVFSANPSCNDAPVLSGVYDFSSNLDCNAANLNLSLGNIILNCQRYNIVLYNNTIILGSSNNVSFVGCDFINFSINESFGIPFNVSFYNSTFSDFSKFYSLIGEYFVYDNIIVNVTTIYGSPAFNATINITSNVSSQITYKNYTDSNGIYSRGVLVYGNYSGGRAAFNNFTVSVLYEGWSNSTRINITGPVVVNFTSLDYRIPYFAVNPVNIVNKSNSTISFAINLSEICNITIMYVNDTAFPPSFWKTVLYNSTSYVQFNLTNLASYYWYNFTINITDRSNNTNSTRFNIRTWLNPFFNITVSSISVSSLSWYGDPENVTNFTIRNQNATIIFSNANISNLQFSNTSFVLSRNFLYINDSVLNGLNRSAIINFSSSEFHNDYKRVIFKYYNVSVSSNGTFSYFGKQLYNTVYSIGNGWIQFNVSSFSAYVSDDDSQLNISNHTKAGNFSQDMFYFWANYSRISNGTSIDGYVGGNCNITFFDGTQTMFYNWTSSKYYYNRTFFGIATNQTFNVTCWSNENNPLRANDTYDVVTRNINTFVILDNLSCLYLGSEDCTDDWVRQKSIVINFSVYNENYSILVSYKNNSDQIGWNTTYKLLDWIYVGNNTKVIFNVTNNDELIVFLEHSIQDPVNSSKSINNYTFTDTIFKDDYTLWFNVKSYVPGNEVVKHSNGILFIDNTNPVFKGFIFGDYNLSSFNGTIIFNRFFNSFKFSYWIRDFESKLSKLQYAFGTEQFGLGDDYADLISWTNLPIYEYNFSSYTILTPNLTEGYQYYLTIYAENNRTTGNSSSHLSDYNATYPILIDLRKPINGSFVLDNITNYYDGYSNSNFSLIRIFTGQDNRTNITNVSGIAWGVLWVKNSTLNGGVCQNNWGAWYIYNVTNVTDNYYYNISLNTNHANCYMLNYKLYDYALNNVDFNKTLISDRTNPQMLSLNDPGGSVYYRVSKGTNGSVMSIGFSAQDNESSIDRFNICLDESSDCSSYTRTCSIYNASHFIENGLTHTIYKADTNNFTDGKKYCIYVSAYNNANLDDSNITGSGTVFLLVKVPVNNLTYFESDTNRKYGIFGGVLSNYTNLVNWNAGPNTTVNVSNLYPYNMSCKWYLNDVSYDANSGNLCLLNGSQRANCIIDTSLQKDYNISISCVNYNILTVYQLADENIDLHFAYDYNELPFVNSFWYNGAYYNATNNVVSVFEDTNVTLRFILSENDTHTKFEYNSSLIYSLENLTITFNPNTIFNNSLDVEFYNQSSNISVFYNVSSKILSVSFNGTINNSELITRLDNNYNLTLVSINDSAMQRNMTLKFYQIMTGAGVSNTTYFISINTTNVSAGRNLTWNQSTGVVTINLGLYYANLSGNTPMKLNFSDYLSFNDFVFVFNITEVNDPVFVNLSYYANNTVYYFNEDAYNATNMTKYFYDADITYGQFENMTYLPNEASQYLNLTRIDNKTGFLNITAISNYFGIVTFKINATDKANESAQTNIITVYVLPQQDAPLVNSSYFGNNSNVSFNEDTILTLNVSRYFYDPDTFYLWNGLYNDSLTYNYSIFDTENFSVYSFNYSSGVLRINSTAANFVGNTTLNISARDALGDTTYALVNVSIILVNDAPIINVSFYNNNSVYTFYEDMPLTTLNASNATKNFIDYDILYGDYLSYNFTVLSDSLNITFGGAPGMFNITINANFSGVVYVNMTAWDTYNESVSVLFLFNITAVNDIPYYVNMTNFSRFSSVNQALNMITLPEDGYVNVTFRFFDNDTSTSFNYSQNLTINLQNITVNFNPRYIYGDNVTIRLINDSTVSTSFVNATYYELNVTFNESINNSRLAYLISTKTAITGVWSGYSNDSVLQYNSTYLLYRQISTGGVSKDIILYSINASDSFNYSFNKTTYTFRMNLSSNYSDSYGLLSFNVNFSDYISYNDFIFLINITPVDDAPRFNKYYSDENQTFYENSSTILNLSAFVYDVESDQFNISFNNTGSLNNNFNISNYNETTTVINLSMKNPNLCGNFNLTVNATQTNNQSLSLLVRIPFNVTCVNSMPEYGSLYAIDSATVDSSNRMVYIKEGECAEFGILFSDPDAASLLTPNPNVSLSNITMFALSENYPARLMLQLYNLSWEVAWPQIYDDYVNDTYFINMTFNGTINNSVLSMLLADSNTKIYDISVTDGAVNQSGGIYYFEKNFTTNVSNSVRIFSINDSLFSLTNRTKISVCADYIPTHENVIMPVLINFTDYYLNNSVIIYVNVTSVDDLPAFNTSHIDAGTTFFEDGSTSFNISAFLYDEENDNITVISNISDTLILRLGDTLYSGGNTFILLGANIINKNAVLRVNGAQKTVSAHQSTTISGVDVEIGSLYLDENPTDAYIEIVNFKDNNGTNNNLWAKTISYNNLTGFIDVVPKDDVTGTVHLTFTTNGSTLYAIDLDIMPVNDAPRINNTNLYVYEDSITTINFTQVLYDIDNDVYSLSYSITNLSDYYPYSNESINFTIIAPTTDNTSVLVFNLSAYDGALYNFTLFNITFVPVNDNFSVSPSAVFTYSFTQGDTLPINLSQIFIDEENNLTYFVVNKSSEDIFYSISNGIISVSSASSGNYNLTLNVLDGPYLINRTFYFEIAQRVVPGGGGSSSGGKKGGGSFVPVLPKENTTQSSLGSQNSKTFVNPRKGELLEFNPDLSFIDSIQYEVYEDINFNVTISVFEVSKDTGFDVIEYKGFTVEHNLPSDYYYVGKVFFNVDALFAKNYDLNVSSIELNTVYDQKLISYPINYLRYDSNKHYFRMDGINKGTFYITGDKNSLAVVEPQATCFDNILNGNEGDVDCGGSCTKKCLNDASCHFNRDCESNYCLDMKCMEKKVSEENLNPIQRAIFGFWNSAFFLAFIFFFLVSVAVFSVVLARHRAQQRTRNDELLPPIEPLLEQIYDTAPSEEFLTENISKTESEQTSAEDLGMKKELFDALVLFSYKVIKEHGEDMIRKVLLNKGYPLTVVEKIIFEAKSNAQIIAIKEEIKNAEDEYGINLDVSRRRKEDLVKIRDTISKIKDELDRYE